MAPLPVFAGRGPDYLNGGGVLGNLSSCMTGGWGRGGWSKGCGEKFSSRKKQSR